MGARTGIEWTDRTFNPWYGCQKVSPGCDNCYAEAWGKRSGMAKWGPGEQRKRTGGAYWKLPLTWQNRYLVTRDRLVDKGQPIPPRPRVFCASLADVFDNAVPEHWRVDLFDLVDRTPNLIWQILTKRPENIERFLPGRPFKNVWLGITAEDQAHYDRRWPILFRAAFHRAARLFVSYEPALGSLDISNHPMPDWIICGGETGPKTAREMEPAWAFNLRAQCIDYGVPFFFKQMSKRKPIPAGLMVREFPRELPSELAA